MSVHGAKSIGWLGLLKPRGERRDAHHLSGPAFSGPSVMRRDMKRCNWLMPLS
jgi:hypothetical protein